MPEPGSQERDQCAAAVLKTTPVVMRGIITHMHDKRGPNMTVAQFRVLFFIIKRPGSSLAQLVEFMGMTAPAASKIVDGLVRKKLVKREADPLDRRRIVLTIKPAGQAIHDQAHQEAQQYMADQLVTLTASQQRTITRAMKLLHKAVSPSGILEPAANPAPVKPVRSKG